MPRMPPETSLLSRVSRWKQALLRGMNEKFDLVCFRETSSVSCERNFSSSKETCTLRRNLLSSALLEVLKHVYKQGRLDFYIWPGRNKTTTPSRAQQRQQLMSSFLLGKKMNFWIYCAAWMSLMIVPRLQLVYTIISSSTRYSA
ncbi:hypothetical protein EDB89DRAFT_1917779 [Lactarius sanguifluus]|nr:hypothetical protein EDB89DRAFT_1917779 [Lactarius sanguifluus]